MPEIIRQSRTSFGSSPRTDNRSIRARLGWKLKWARPTLGVGLAWLIVAGSLSYAGLLTTHGISDTDFFILSVVPVVLIACYYWIIYDLLRQGPWLPSFV